MKSNSIYLIICEGDSEYAYIQELNRFLNDRRLPLVLIPFSAGGGGFTSLRLVCRAKKTRRNGRTFIMADNDIYFRNDNGNGSQYEKDKDVLPPFLFQYWNFEEFLLMHFPSALLDEWRRVATESGHRAMPKHGVEFIPMYARFCEEHKDAMEFDLPYEKGDMPFNLTEAHLAHLRENNKADYPHSEFATFLFGRLEHKRLWGRG